MTSEVTVTLKGFHRQQDPDNPVIQVFPGRYFYKDGKHYVMYDEIVDNQRMYCRIKMSKDVVEVTKRGYMSANMFFERGRKTISRYDSPFGVIETRFLTSDIRIREEEERIALHMVYDMEMNRDFISTCIMDIIVETPAAFDIKNLKNT